MGDAMAANAHYDNDGHLIHNSCAVCGADAPYGFGVALRKGQLGMWYCRKHRPLVTSPRVRPAGITQPAKDERG